MNIQNRLKKIEQNLSTKPNTGIGPGVCEHPPSMFKLRQDYPVTGYADRRSVIVGHCNACGFDDFLWSHYALKDEQEEHRQELKYASKFWEWQAYDLELINAGLIKYAL